MNKGAVNPEWNLPAIADAAGATDFYYSGGQLYADVDESTLISAISAYDHNAELAKPSKTKGFDYNGTMVPVTLEDASGAMQIKIGFEEFGIQSTNFELSNGQTITITLAEWPTFKAAFFAFRASFFTG